MNIITLHFVKTITNMYIPCFVVCIPFAVHGSLPGTKWEMMEQIRADIRDFKKQKNLVKVTFIFLTCNLVQ